MASDNKRPARVAVQVKQELARLVGTELADPRLDGLVIAGVTMTSDLRLARVFYRLAPVDAGGEAGGGAGEAGGEEARRRGAQAALERASGKLRREITDRLGLRYAPELRFAYDAGQEARDRIDQLLDEVARERKG